jgi:hypothetical protein
MPRRSKVFRYDATTGTVVEVERVKPRHRPRYPLAVETLAVNPAQIGEAREYDRAHGVPTEYRGDGSPIVSDSRHYAKYRKLHNAHFRNGFSR